MKLTNIEWGMIKPPGNYKDTSRISDAGIERYMAQGSVFTY